MKIKQVIVVRYKYPDGNGGLKKVRTGKLIAQACHASMKVFFDRMVQIVGAELPDEHKLYSIEMDKAMADWKDGIFTKTVVYVESEEALDELKKQADEAGIINAGIVDCGLTEFNGVPTKTCLAIGPADAEKIDLITGKLPLL